MPIEFLKFRIKKGKWWKHGNFIIYDEKDEVAYRVESKVRFLSATTYLRSEFNSVEYRIEKASNWKLNYNLFENDNLIANIDKPQSWNKPEYIIETSVAESFKLVGDIWKGQYGFVRNEKDFGIVSHNIWSTGEFGVAIKEGEHIPMMLSVVIIMALLKASGM